MRPRRNLLSLAALALLFAVAIPRWAPVLADGGRDYHRCIQACGEIGKRCDERCDTDCAAMFPGDQDLFSTCVKTCRDYCTGQRQECRTVCKILKGPSSDPEP